MVRAIFTFGVFLYFRQEGVSGMYPASNAFHAAVENGNHQIMLLVFPDALFSNEDIDVDKGVEFNDYFNTQDDLAVGQALSNELSFSLFNDKRLLNDYEFGQFRATLGVQVGDEEITYAGNCMVQDGTNTYVGRDTSPYLQKNGSAMANAPAWPVKSLLSYNGKLYVFGEHDNHKVYNESTGAVVAETVNAFMLDKVRRDYWMQGVRYDDEERSLTFWRNGHEISYEFVPLGTFIADRPNAPDNIEVDFNCNDIMMKFKGDMPSRSALGISYPITFKALLTALCNRAGVPYGGEDFINSSATLQKEPEEFSNCTMRDVVGWIAEAACANARISRDGYLVMSWLKQTTQSLNEHDYSDFQPYWYETQTVNKLHNRTTQDGSEKTQGSGTVGYLIQDNPLLKGVS